MKKATHTHTHTHNIKTEQNRYKIICEIARKEVQIVICTVTKNDKNNWVGGKKKKEKQAADL